MKRLAVIGMGIIAAAASCQSPPSPLSSSSSSASVVTPETVGLSSSRLDRLDSLLVGVSERGELGGSVALIARHGRVAYLRAFGWADVPSRRPMETDAIMRIFSMTKPLTCTAAMALVDDGRLLLTDPVSKYIPGFSNASVAVGEDGNTVRLAPAEQPITVRMLASHTSGVVYIPPAEQYPELVRRFEEADLFDPYQTLERMVGRLAELPLMHQPGTTWEYSSSTDVLARVVEVASGQPFGSFLHERIFEPLGMEDTGFTVPEEDWERVATVHTRDEDGSLIPAPYDGILVRDDFKSRSHEAGGHGLVSTASDYARFAQMLLNGGELDGVRVISPKATELMRMNVLQNGVHVMEASSLPMLRQPALGYGLCGSVVQEPSHHAALTSEGAYSWSGYASTHFFIDPEEDLVAVFMGQHVPINPDQLFERFANVVYQAIIE